jgi:hypothetical protein
MACTGHNGVTPNYVACGGYIAPASPYSFTTPDLIGGVHNVQDYHYNEIRAAIAQELTRRGWSWATVGGDPGTVTQGATQVTYLQWRALRDRIYNIWAWGYAWTTNSLLSPGVEIHEETVEELRWAINVAKSICYCQCNYACTCNCNYACTCNCNYACTCNCNYPCTCNCNYYCTCNCAYSDIRLKKEIEYI